MMRFILILFAFAFVNSKAFIDVYFDFASFKADGQYSKVEIYYSVKDTAFTYQYLDGEYKGEIEVTAKIKSNVKIENQSQWSILSTVKQKSDLKSAIVLGMEEMLIYPGKYELEIDLRDKYKPSKTHRIKEKIIVPDYSGTEVSMSDIQFATLIEKKEKATINWSQSFLKSAYYIVPNATTEFYKVNSKDVFINLYYELYNLNFYDDFLIEYRIYNAINKEEYYLPVKKSTESASIFQQISLPMDILPTGVYKMKISVSYPISEPVASVEQEKQFFLFSDIGPQLNAQFTENERFEMSEFSGLSIAEIEDEFGKMKIIASNAEIAAFERLGTNQAKKRFLYRFWSERDPDTTTIVNESLIEYRRLIEFADIYFPVGKMKNGWNTERGHILLKYGMPTERLEFPANKELRPYEEWFYQDVEGGVMFYFVDVMGYGDFFLVHSTAMNQVRNENWYNEFVLPNNRYDRLNEQGNR